MPNLATVTGTLLLSQNCKFTRFNSMTATLMLSAYDFSADALVTSAAISTHSTANNLLKVLQVLHILLLLQSKGLTAVAQGASIDLGTLPGLKSC